MNLSLVSKKPVTICNRIRHEHEAIQEELINLKVLLFSGEAANHEEEFRERFHALVQILEIHLTSEERVVLKKLYKGPKKPIRRTRTRQTIQGCVERVCDLNSEIDQTIDALESCSWKKLDTIQMYFLALIELFELHILYEEKKLFNPLSKFPRNSQKRMTRELVSREREFLGWLLAVEGAGAPASEWYQ